MPLFVAELIDGGVVGSEDSHAFIFVLRSSLENLARKKTKSASIIFHDSLVSHAVLALRDNDFLHDRCVIRELPGFSIDRVILTTR